ncbi:Putative sensory transduction regulator [Aliiroseovarius sediminilitoris]|uniref:Putative sensory transduction regulator n=1 Tax=Aliiroseovarius sediminilitoris TaxID=1173584 RepID=A0A1I0MJ30_9RHOB|nr:YbjN domain-containing protein [Aliiroseovarius sediminilitoris]SEV88377.1 Putative sensory transduction regulator [Aliiroseovarius sediminilitoris]
MKLQELTASAVIGAGLATSAFADPIKASDPQTVLAYFQDIGAPATLTEDSVGDPLIELQYYGTTFAIFFYGCSDNINCNSLQFYAGYTAENEISSEALNTWNAEQRYGRVYQDDEGNKKLEYDIYTGNAGVDSDDFDEMFDIWTELVESFEAVLS